MDAAQADAALVQAAPPGDAAPGVAAPEPAAPRSAALGARAASYWAAPFDARHEQPLSGKPEGLCSGDFDGDGTPDVAATLVSPGTLLVWSSSSAGLAHGFETYDCGAFPLPPVALPPESFGAPRAAQRIAVASRATRTLELAAPDCRTFALERVPRALAAGVAGGTALVAIACDGRRLEILRDGAAALETWKLAADLPRCALVSTSLAAILVGFQDATTVEAYDARDGARIGALEVGSIPRALAELDVDGDGDPELAVAGGDHEILIFGAGAPGGARGWFETDTPLAWHADAIPTALGVGDFDRDGRDDLAVLNDFSQSLQVLTRLSTAGAKRHPSFYVGQTPCGLAVLDVDVDGVLDFVAGNRDTQGLARIHGDGAGALRVGNLLRLDDFPMTIAARPADAAGALRLVLLNAKTNSLSAVALEAGLLHAWPGVPCGSEPRAPKIRELDPAPGPGGTPGLDAAFLVTGRRGSDLCLYRGDEQGRLEPAATLELGFGAGDLALTDLDGDGRPEVLVSDPQGAVVLLLEHAALHGDASALAAAARLAVPSLPVHLVPIELDLDPAPEFACVLGSPGERVGVAWLDLARTDSGALQLVELGYTPLAGAPLEAAACDLDGDGRLDLAVLVTRAHDSPVGAWHALLRGPGGPADFRLAATTPTGLLPRGLAAGDADGDGRAEVFVSIQTSTLVQAWTPEQAADGAPFALRPLDGLGAGRGPLDLCLSDADGDGVLDLCVANAFSNDVSVLRGAKR